MQLFNDENVENILTSAYLIKSFDVEMTDKLSNLLYDHNNCNIYLSSKTWEGTTDKSEKWYGTQYSKEPICDKILSDIYSGDSYSELSLPLQNEYLPKNFDLFPKSPELSAIPVKIRDEGSSIIWYK